VVTAQYVRLTGDIASETRDARLDALRPALVLELEPIGALHTVFSLVNAGQGTAVDVDVTITFHPRDADKADHSVRWRAPSLAPGSHAQFMPESQMNTDVIVNAYSHVTVEGETKDVAGRVHPVKVLVDDLPGWNALVVTAHQRAEPDQLKRIADAVSKLAK
jgi:hypothetical protein